MRWLGVLCGGLVVAACASGAASGPPTAGAAVTSSATSSDRGREPREGVAIEVSSHRSGTSTLVLASGWNVPRGASSWTHLAKLDVSSFPSSVRCPARSRCRIALAGDPTTTAELFTFDAKTEIRVDLDAPERQRVHYEDPDGLAATLAQVDLAATRLADACAGKNALLHAAAQAGLRAIADDPRPTIRDGARLAWLSVRCPANDAKVEEARTLRAQRDLDPSALSLWPTGAGAAAILTSDSEDWLVALADAHPDPKTGVSILVGYGYELVHRQDKTGARAVFAQLQRPRYEGIAGGGLLNRYVNWDERILVDPGEALPRLEGVGVTSGVPIDTDAMRGRPVLLYLTSVYCGRCRHTLPILRRLADAHPDVQILVVPLDDTAGAAAKLAKRYAPVPGVVVDNSRAVVDAVTSTLMDPHVYPSYIYADAEGVVRATSLQGPLDELATELRR